jgi:4-methyl-5(b-hydroxyethyl)-thiazole monophosphate biosynthesis
MMVYIFLADGFEEIEAVYPIDVLRRCGVQVVTVGIGGKLITGSNGIVVKPDISINELKDKAKKIEMLILPGGPGRVNIIKNEKAMSIIAFCFKYDVPIRNLGGTRAARGQKLHLLSEP